MGKVTKLLSALAEEYGDDIVRTVRRVLGEGAQPEQIEAAVKRTAAQTPKPRSRAAPNLRAMDTDQAIRTARKKPHLKQSSDGQYVGAPRGVRSERQLASNRRNFDKDVVSGIEGADWYSRAREANREWAGPDPARQRLLAQEEALWSAQAQPDPNLGQLLSAHNAYEMGAPLAIARTAAQANKYRTARDAGSEIPLGKKTGPYGQHLDPTMPHATTGTNDIWHARGFGFADNEVESGLSDATHRFLDYETLLAVDRARKQRLGGRDDWLAHEIQAAPWVAGKGRSLSERYNLSEEEGLRRAAQTYPDFADKYTAFGTGEQVPYKESAHLPGINTASDAERLSFSRDPGRRWDDADQRDVIYDALGLYQRPSIQGTGVYKPPDGVLENNPVSVARPLIGIKSPGKLDDASRSAMNLAETLRSYVDAQGSGAWHSVFEGVVPDRGSLFASRSGPSDPETVKRLMDISAPYGLGDVVDTGQGLTITNFYPGPPSGGATSKALRTGGLREQIANVTDAPLGRVAVDSNYIGMLEEAPTPGAGVATRILLDEVAKNPESVMDKLDAYDLLRQRYASGAEADDAVAATYGGVRSDIQTARRILAEKGIRGLKAAYEAGVPLPALLAATGLSQYRQSDDDGGY